MKLIDNLIEELTNSSIPLTDTLIKTKVLAFKLKNNELINWLNNELNGYDNDELPDYRILTCQVVGTISNGFQRAKNYPIPLFGLDEDVRGKMLTIQLSQSISTLDDLVKRDKAGRLSMNIPPETYGYLSKDLGNRFVIEYAVREIDHVQVIQVLTSVRTKLLDFLLKINEEIGDNIDTKKIADEETKDKIASIFHSSVFGDNATIIVGDNNIQTVTNVKKADFESLANFFKENFIENKDIDDLKKDIDSDNPNSSNKIYGIKVKKWISKMLEKAVGGSWQISLGAAGKVLADGISTYYGWK